MAQGSQLRVAYEDLDVAEDYPQHLYNGEPFTGIAVDYDDAKRLLSEDSFVDGILDGLSCTYFESGHLKAKERLQRGGLHGLCQYWFENGQLAAEKLYEHGGLLRERIWNENGEVIKDW